MKPKFSTVTSKGQLVIPAKLRRQLGIRKGTRVSFAAEGHRLILQPLTREYIRSLQGSWKDGGPSALDLLLEDRRREREL